MRKWTITEEGSEVCSSNSKTALSIHCVICYISQNDLSHAPFSCRKRILATSGDFLYRMQQPDSTVISEPSSRETSLSSCAASTVLSSSTSVPMDSKKPCQLKRLSVISVDYDSDHSDSLMNVKSLHKKDSRTVCLENETICDSPSTDSHSKHYFNCEKTNIDFDNSDLFFSPKKTETVVPQKSQTSTAADDIEADDFYIDDFDIDDFNDSDIPGYFDDPPPSSGPIASTVTTTVKEGGPSKSVWEKKPTTPAPASKPSNICSPGKSDG